MRHAPFAANAPGSNDMVLTNMSQQTLSHRRALLGQIDSLRRQLDTADVIDGMDACYQQAFEILTSGKLVNALDVELEDPALRERYGRGSKEPAGYGDAGWLRNEDFLVAGAPILERGTNFPAQLGRQHGDQLQQAQRLVRSAADVERLTNHVLRFSKRRFVRAQLEREGAESEQVAEAEPA